MRWIKCNKEMKLMGKHTINLRTAAFLIVGCLLSAAVTSPLMGKGKKNKKKAKDTTTVVKDSTVDTLSRRLPADTVAKPVKADVAGKPAPSDSIDSLYRVQAGEIKRLKDSIKALTPQVEFADSCIANLALSRLYDYYEKDKDAAVIEGALQLYDRIYTPRIKAEYKTVPELLKRYWTDMDVFLPVAQRAIAAADRAKAAAEKAEAANALLGLDFYKTYYKNGKWVYPHLYIGTTIDYILSRLADKGKEE